MRYHFPIPLSAIIAYMLIVISVTSGLIPNPMDVLSSLKNYEGWWLYLALFLVIFAESIIYVGFYFPGQLLAVLVIVVYDFSVSNLVALTVVSILAVILSAAINYYLGWYFLPHREKERQKIRYKELIPAMLHINILALYVFEQGGRGTDRNLIWMTGLLNLPYYLLLISGTFLLQDYLIRFGQNPWILAVLLLIWLLLALWVDLRKYRRNRKGDITS